MPNTLFGRLLVASLLLLSVFFWLLSYIIVELNHENILAGKEEQLRLQNFILLSSAQFGDDDNIELPDELREPRFDEFESGLYGFITDNQGKILWRSYSSHTLKLNLQLLRAPDNRAGFAQFIFNEQYYIYHYGVLWEFIDDQPQLLTFTVLENNGPALASNNRFKQRLYLWLSIIGLALISILLLVLRWGTRPLRQLAASLKQVEKGKADRLEGKYPVELRRLTRNLNELLATEQRQRERYHSTLADLAHSLKTPLAVIQSVNQPSADDPDTGAQVIAEQTQRMDDIIKHQLQRAVVAPPRKIGETVAIDGCAKRLCTALAKVYADKGITFQYQLEPESVFQGDQRDLIEVLGNLLDNACKACLNTVKISATTTGTTLVIAIHDDGAGIPLELRHQLIKRGLRDRKSVV